MVRTTPWPRWIGPWLAAIGIALASLPAATSLKAEARRAGRQQGPDRPAARIDYQADEQFGRSTLILADASRTTGRLVGIDAQWRLTLETGAGRRDVDPEQLVRWGQWRDQAAGPAIVLSDGGQFQIDDWRWDEDRLVLIPAPTSAFEQVMWPRAAVRGVILQWPASRIDRDRLVRRIADADLSQDEVWLDSGDRIQGTLRVTPEPDEPDEKKSQRVVNVRTKAGDVAIAWQRVTAVALRKTTGRRAPHDGLHAWIGFRDGTCIDAHRLAVRGDQVELELIDGAKLTADAASFWSDVRYVQPLGAATLYLSDLEPVGYKHIPFLTQTWDWARNGGVTGGRLRAAGGVYRKGLGLHSSARLAYDLPGEFTWFQAELAIDESAGRGGSVIFRVYIDRGDGQWQKAYESSTVRGGADPVPINVDVRGARRLALIVDFADRGDELDHADWLDARLVR